ncbi:histidine kinase N-terminal 7TM domain-containing protein [Oceanispirochaeta sp.]|uniref:histidine kinase N-terminal 7TM domain-containing diguanylate cyclase n=1 Tax=Oceanispirochaeta sp. TaxID=2035350 RepID=UPI00261A44A4|nr:histidine kinase N-terminal 7TM domain-containing protein [Oceanispirochaeta sp.]MDA3957866.1 diguanylate cyclase [Oceanispirochaeta sp.]
MLIYYWFPYLISAVINILLAFYILRYRKKRGAFSLLVQIISISIWSILEGLIWFDLDLETRRLICSFQYIFIVLVPTFFFIFSYEYTGRSIFTRRRYYAALFLIPLFTIFMVWTDAGHHLFYTDYWIEESGPIRVMVLSYGPVFKIWALYAYALAIWSATVILKSYHTSPVLNKKQYVAILLGMAIPYFGNITYLLNLFPLPIYDLTPLMYTFTAFLLSWAFSRNKLLDLIPVARSEVLKNMSDGVMILDNHGRVGDLNPAAEMILELPSQDAVGCSVSDLFKDKPELVEVFLNTKEQLDTIKMIKEGNEMFYDIRRSPLIDRKNYSMGRILVLRDMTEQRKMEKELERFATTDTLTGILNRRHFTWLAENELIRTKRYNSAISLIMIDIDHFKDVNDNYGHDVGDMVLKAMVRTCQEKLREIDLFARWGGEEFVILLPETGSEAANEVAERLREAIENMVLPSPSEDIKITISLGLTEFILNKTTLSSGLKKADQAMYLSKRQGRNRVSCLKES